MRVEDKNIDELIPYRTNPRKNNRAVKEVARSIKRFGFKVPVVVDRDNVIVCGHTRYKACKKLGIKTVPCVVADDLSEEEIKAFRLAENRVSEEAGWDYDMLKNELGNIFSFDMSDFGFDFATPRENKQDVQHRVENILNLAKAQYIGVGRYDIPQLEPVSARQVGEIKEWIGFNYVLTDKAPKGKGVHFFIDDYQFERIWKSPEKYVDKLKKYRAVLTPDFSPYGDMPLATQIYNHYRKHWVGKFLQENGVTVIPTIRASTDERSLEWFLEGEPAGGVVCISNMWTGDKEEKDYFLNKEFRLMKEKLRPEKVLIYGQETPELKGENNVEYIDTFTKKRYNIDGKK